MIFILKRPLPLCCFAGFEYLFKPGCGLVTEFDQVSSEDQRGRYFSGWLRRTCGCDCERSSSELFDGQWQSGGQRRASAEICFDQADQLSERCGVQSSEQSADGFVAECGAGVYEVFGDQWQDGGDVLCGSLNFLQELCGHGDSGSRVSWCFPASLLEDSCGGFAEVVAECGQQQFFLLLRIEAVAAADICGLIADMQCVHPDIAFRVPVGILRSLLECCEFGEQRELAGVLQ